MKIAKRRHPSAFIPTASMGDIAFLLIIFFMVCSNFVKETGIQWTPPDSPSIQTLEQASVSVTIDREGVIYFNGIKVPDAQAVEWGVKSLLQNRTDAKERLVLFRCDRSVSKNVFEPVIESIAKGGGVIAAVGESSSASNP